MVRRLETACKASGSGTGTPDPVTTDALARALDRASGARPIPGNAIRLLDAPGALMAMLEAITTAHHSVNFENYIIKADATGRRFAEALEQAASRGVTVRVLYDPVGCRTTPIAWWESRSPGRRHRGCHRARRRR